MPSKKGGGKSEARVKRFLSSADTLRKLYRVTRIVTETKFRLPDWQDAAHAVILKSLDRATSFKGETEEQFLAWYTSILHSHLLDHLRKNKREIVGMADELQENLLSITQEEQLAPIVNEQERALQRSRLEEALGALPARQQTIVTLRYLFNCSTKEVAELLGISESGVRTAQFRALGSLRDLLAGGGSASGLPP